MIKRYKKLILLFVVSFLLFILIRPVFALEVTYPAIPGFPSVNSDSTTSDYIGYFFGLAIVSAGVMGVISIVIAGITLIALSSNPSAVGEARDRIFNSILGIILLMFSFVLLRTINPQIVGAGIQLANLQDGVYYVKTATTSASTGVKVLPAPTGSYNIKEIPVGYETLLYKCSPPGPNLMVWTYGANGAPDDLKFIPCIDTSADPSSINGATLSLSSSYAFERDYEKPGVYFYSNDNCQGPATKAITESTSLPPFFQAIFGGLGIRSARIINGNGDFDPRYGFVLNKDPALKGECSKPFMNFDAADINDPNNVGICVSVVNPSTCGGTSCNQAGQCVLGGGGTSCNINTDCAASACSTAPNPFIPLPVFNPSDIGYNPNTINAVDPNTLTYPLPILPSNNPSGVTPPFLNIPTNNPSTPNILVPSTVTPGTMSPTTPFQIPTTTIPPNLTLNPFPPINVPFVPVATAPFPPCTTSNPYVPPNPVDNYNPTNSSPYNPPNTPLNPDNILNLFNINAFSGSNSHLALELRNNNQVNSSPKIQTKNLPLGSVIRIRLADIMPPPPPLPPPPPAPTPPPPTPPPPTPPPPTPPPSGPTPPPPTPPPSTPPPSPGTTPPFTPPPPPASPSPSPSPVIIGPGTTSTNPYPYNNPVHNECINGQCLKVQGLDYDQCNEQYPCSVTQPNGTPATLPSIPPTTTPGTGSSPTACAPFSTSYVYIIRGDNKEYGYPGDGVSIYEDGGPVNIYDPNTRLDGPRYVNLSRNDDIKQEFIYSNPDQVLIDKGVLQEVTTGVTGQDTCAISGHTYPCTKTIEPRGNFLTILYGANEKGDVNKTCAFFANKVDNIHDEGILSDNRIINQMYIFPIIP